MLQLSESWVRGVVPTDREQPLIQLSLSDCVAKVKYPSPVGGRFGAPTYSLTGAPIDQLKPKGSSTWP